MEAKVWPRTCAIAERLWSDPIDTNWKEAESRILEQRRRMAVFRDIHADIIQPEFCRQNDGFCHPLTNSMLPIFPIHAEDVMLNHDAKIINVKMDNSEGQVRNINDVIKWTVFVIVLLILIMVKRRLVCAVVLKVVEYCRTIVDAGGPHGPGMRMISIR